MVASWYGPGFHGKLTASGEVYDMYSFSAAHKTLPFGTILCVKNQFSGRAAAITINDRGPFIDGRDLDLSYKAAERLGIVHPGTSKVKVSILGRDMRYVKYIRLSGTVDSGPYTVQVAAFIDAEKAVRLKKSLELEYKAVYLKPAEIKGTQVYRVRVGKFGNKSSAIDLAKTLAQVGYNTLITKYDS